MAAFVNTVTGPILPEQLGKTLSHEHFVFGFAGFEGDITLGGFDRGLALSRGIAAAEKVKAYGVKTVIDATTNECGRFPELLRDISEATGVQVICATGFYNETSAPGYFKYRARISDIVQEIYEMYVKEIEEGIGKTKIKAGIIKLASSAGIITDYEKAFFRAAARAQRDTGAVIETHTSDGTMALEQAELLLSEGADPRKVVIGHMCGNPNISEHLALLDTGVFAGFDRFSLDIGGATDRSRKALLAGLAGLGYSDRLLLSHDTVNYRLGRPVPAVKERNITHIFEAVIPDLLQAGVTGAQLENMLIHNPRRLFSAPSPPA